MLRARACGAVVGFERILVHCDGWKEGRKEGGWVGGGCEYRKEQDAHTKMEGRVGVRCEPSVVCRVRCELWHGKGLITKDWMRG